MSIHLIDRDPNTGLEIFKRWNKKRTKCLGYVVGKADQTGKKLATIVGGSEYLSEARAIAKRNISHPVRETTPKAIHAARDAAARRSKPKRG